MYPDAEFMISNFSSREILVLFSIPSIFLSPMFISFFWKNLEILKTFSFLIVFVQGGKLLASN